MNSKELNMLDNNELERITEIMQSIESETGDFHEDILSNTSGDFHCEMFGVDSVYVDIMLMRGKDEIEQLKINRETFEVE